MSADLLLHSLSNFSEILFRILEISDCSKIVEVGSEYGTFSAKLCEYARSRKGMLVTIEPCPKDAALDFINANRNTPWFQLIQGNSIPALGTIKDVDAYIIDGDHNYYTVYHELELLYQVQREQGHKILVMEHDVSWPWAYRDLYYNPSTIPAEFLQPHDLQRGVTRSNNGLIEGGFRSHGQYGIASQEGGPRNGVRLAIEDFIKLHAELRLKTIPAIFGLGIVYDADALWAQSLEAFLSPYSNNSLIEKLEQNRLDLYLKVLELQDQISFLMAPPKIPECLVEPPKKLRPVLDEAAMAALDARFS
ncbi:MAG: hypothetical protein JWN25_3562 [Verrucomicrobiales bacterium]|nr:hypothetical protein [Verrucomicrobiales bacterium]